MKEFTYQDYLRYERLKFKEMHGNLQLREPEVKYNVHQPHDKILKIVLEEKSQVTELLNRILHVKLTESEIEKYENQYINYMFENSESDIVYKMKEKEIFFLIEHQSKIDYSMPKRILEYESAIIQKALKGKYLTKKNHKLPRVIPIVIYTGNKKWDVEKYIEECQEILTESNRVKLGEYYVLDVNDYTDEELEKDTLFLSTILRLEKSKTEEEIIRVLKKAIQMETEENREILKRTIAFILDGKIDEKNKEELLKELEKEEKSMVLEVLRKESEKQRREGKKEGIKENTFFIAKKMLEKNMKITDIEEITGLSVKQLEKLKI